MNIHALRADLPQLASAVAGGGPSAPSASPATVVTVPCPPSVNEMFRNKAGKGRVPTRAYEDWLGHAGWTLRSQRPRAVRGRTLLIVSVERISSSADIDNHLKAIIDLLVKHDVIDDDKFVTGICIAWAPPSSKLARVMILPVGEYQLSFLPAPDGASAGFFLAPPSETDECP